MIHLDQYNTYEEGYRTHVVEDVEYRIALEPGTNLWSISTDKGQVPVVLRGQYTTAGHAVQSIKDYQANAPARKALYKKV